MKSSNNINMFRYKCSVCDYGAWSKEHVLSHASKNHRTRNSHDFAIEQPKEVYFSKYMEPSQTVVPAISGTLLNHNFEDFKIDSAVPKTYKCGVNLENGGVHHGDQADMVPASLIAGLKYQNISDSSDSEVSFNKRVVGKRRRHSSEGSDDKPRAKTNKSDDTKGNDLFCMLVKEKQNQNMLQQFQGICAEFSCLLENGYNFMVVFLVAQSALFVRKGRNFILRGRGVGYKGASPPVDIFFKKKTCFQDLK